MRPLRSLMAAVLMVASGCSAAETVGPLPASELQAAPLTVTVGGQALVLVPELWRDFQPVSPPDGKPLVAVLRVQTAKREVLTSSFYVDAAWISNGAEVWSARVGDDRLASPSPVYYEVTARDGPKWGPGVPVDVVVRIREGSGGTRLLRAAGQMIRRTD
jgi:hypothetical protein